MRVRVLKLLKLCRICQNSQNQSIKIKEYIVNSGQKSLTVERHYISDFQLLSRKMITFLSCVLDVTPWYTLSEYLLSSELHVLCLLLNKVTTR